jgi:hypothetical protein
MIHAHAHAHAPVTFKFNDMLTCADQITFLLLWI